MKKIFLTGASAGIGRATAQLLTQKGYEVWGTSRGLERLPAMDHFHPVELNLNDPVSIREGFSKALKQAKRFDIVINNAGGGLFGASELLEEKVWQEQLQTLFWGPMQLTRLALASMREWGSGLIINVTSLAVEFPIPFMGSYNVGKAAFSALTKTLRLELGHTPIEIVEIQPGDIRTPFHHSMEVRRSSQDDYYRVMQNAYAAIDKNMNEAPQPDIVARKILQTIMNSERGPVRRVGGWGQVIMAHLGMRLASSRMIEMALRLLYRLDKRGHHESKHSLSR